MLITMYCDLEWMIWINQDWMVKKINHSTLAQYWDSNCWLFLRNYCFRSEQNIGLDFENNFILINNVLWYNTIKMKATEWSLFLLFGFIVAHFGNLHQEKTHSYRKHQLLHEKEQLKFESTLRQIVPLILPLLWGIVQFWKSYLII